MSEEPLFHEALSKPVSERAAFLDADCAGQPELRAAVEALLAAHEAPGSLLDKPPGDLGCTVASDAGDPKQGVAKGGDTGVYTPEPERVPTHHAPSEFHSHFEPGLVI